MSKTEREDYNKSIFDLMCETEIQYEYILLILYKIADYRNLFIGE